MKAVVFPAIVLVLAACTTTTPSSRDSSDYSANRLPDGSIELVVTGTTSAPTHSTGASLELGTMLEDAAAKECPSGYDLSQDAAPSVRTEAGMLIATLRGVARCE